MTRRLSVAAAFAIVGAAFAQEPTPDPATFVPEVARQVAADGNEAFDKGDFDSARRSYERVLDLAPGNLVALVNLGLIEFRNGHDDKAEKFLKQAVTERLETGPAWLTLGMLYVRQDHIEEAFAALSQAVFYDKGSARAHSYLGVVLGRKGWYDGAEAELRRAVEIDPELRDAHYNLAVLYLRQKPPAVELARRHYFKSLDLGGKPDKDIEKKLSAAVESP